MGRMTCEKCCHVQPINIKALQMEKGIERIYIECEKCNDQRTCYYTNEEIRKMQAQQRLTLSIPNVRQSTIAKNRKAIKKKMNDLKRKMEAD